MSQLGYWEPKTSNIDWCEDNYYISYYITIVCNDKCLICFLNLLLTTYSCIIEHIVMFPIRGNRGMNKGNNDKCCV